MNQEMNNYQSLATVQTDDVILLLLVVIVAFIIRDEVKNKGLRRW